VVFLIALSIVTTTLLSALEPEEFELRTHEGALVADQNTRYVFLYRQDPETKLITATLQVYNGGASGAEDIVIAALSIDISFNAQVAPYNTVTGQLFTGKQTGNSNEFLRYCSPLVSSTIEVDGLPLTCYFSNFGSSYMERNITRGGIVGARLSTGDSTNFPYLIIGPGETLDVVEFYFMPVNGTDVLNIDMFGYDYLYDIEDTRIRVTTYLLNGFYSLEARSNNIPADRIFILSPGSFKVHVQRPLPISADNNSRTIVGYNPATMEWSDDGITYNTGEPYVPDVGGIIYVRGIGDSEYSGNDATYGDYKKYVPSESQVTFGRKPGYVDYYTVTFDGNGGTPVVQTRVVAENDAVGADMPDDPTRDGYMFTGEWNTEEDGSGRGFTDSTVVTGDIRVSAQWVVAPIMYHTVTFDGNGGTPAEQTREVPQNTNLGTNMPSSPQQSGYTFAGWNMERDGTGATFNGLTVVTRTLTVYAIWRIDEPIEFLELDVPLVFVNPRHIYAFKVDLGDDVPFEDVVFTVGDTSYATVNENRTITIHNKTGAVTLTATDPVSGRNRVFILRIVVSVT